MRSLIVMPGTRTRRLVLLSCVFVVLVARAASAVDPSKHISQYAHSSWRIQDGFLSGTPRAIAQTRDGYLWIGTRNGVFRFDGVRFMPWTPPAGRRLPSRAINALLGARDGSLWIATESGVSHWTNGNLVNYGEDGIFEGLLEDQHGGVWVLRYRPMNSTVGLVCRLGDLSMRCYGETEGVAMTAGSASAADGRDGFWIGGGSSLAHWRPGFPAAFAANVPAAPHAVDGILALAVTPEGTVWVGGPGLASGLQQHVDGAWRPFAAPNLDSRNLTVTTLLLDRQRALWVGTYQGVYRIRDGRVDGFDVEDGLSSNSVQNVFEDREGNVWVATADGLDCFRDVRVSTLSAKEGVITAEVNSVLASRDGTLWLSGVDVLIAFRTHGIASIRKRDGLPGRTIATVFEDHDSRLWVGIDRTLYVYEHGRFTPVNGRDGRPLGLIVGMAEDVDQNIWAEVSGTPRRLLRIRDRVVQEEFPAPQFPPARKIAADPGGGIWLGLMTGDLARYRSGRLETFHVERRTDAFVRQLAVNPDGSVVGAAEFGLIGLKDGRTRTLTVRNGLPCDSVNAFVEDARGAWWLYMECALVKVTQTELDRWWADPKAVLQTTVLDSADGVRPGFAPFQGAARTPDGRLWFANNLTLQVLDPSQLEDHAPSPAVIVEQVIADRASYSPESGLRIPPLVRDLQIDYTAMRLAAPQKVRFRYQLENRDTSWQEAGTRRQAFYSDLRPGKYRFHVAASNSDGAWNGTGTTFDFSILPAWYQTGSFKTMALLSGLLSGWALYHLRLRRLSVQFNRGLEARVSERTRIARELHDTLLQSFHGVLVHFQAATNLLPDRPDEAKRKFEGVIDRAARAITEGRDAVDNLRASTLMTNDLAHAIGVLGDELVAGEVGTHAVVRVNVEGTPRDLRPILRDDVYRIAAEAVRNAVRHAEANLIQVDLGYDDRRFRLRVHDDGRGIDPAVADAHAQARHWGLPGMRERAELIGGRLEVRSRLGSGTEINLSIPAATAYAAASDRRRPR